MECGWRHIIGSLFAIILPQRPEGKELGYEIAYALVVKRKTGGAQHIGALCEHFEAAYLLRKVIKVLH